MKAKLSQRKHQVKYKGHILKKHQEPRLPFNGPIRFKCLQIHKNKTNRCLNEKIFLPILTILSVFMLGACGGAGNTPEKTVDEFMTAYKALEPEDKAETKTSTGVITLVKKDFEDDKKSKDNK